VIISVAFYYLSGFNGVFLALFLRRPISARVYVCVLCTILCMHTCAYMCVCVFMRIYIVILVCDVVKNYLDFRYVCVC
jgi:hypothetical protein